MRSAAVTLLKVANAIDARSMTKHCRLPILLLFAAIVIGCRGEKLFAPPVKPPVLTTIELTPAAASILQGGSITVGVTLRRTGGLTVPLNLTVTDVPTGLAAVVSDVQSTGSVTTATLAVNASGTTIPRSYGLLLHAIGTGVTEATKIFTLTVEPSAFCSAGGVCEQWAASATSMSQAAQPYSLPSKATGPANVARCDENQGDDEAWGALLKSNGVEWLELVYDQGVRPTEIHIYEALGASAIVKVEVKDGPGTYHTVYAAHPEDQACPRVLTIPVTGISAMVKVVRLTFEWRALNNYVEIDAVKLIGDR